MTQAAKLLARNIRVPGFRAGKAPPPVVIKRVGREAVLDEAVRESLGGWYRAAIDDARVVPVGEPDVDLGELPEEGEPLKFSIEIGVRPKATLGDYKGLEVGKREADGRRRGGRRASSTGCASARPSSRPSTARPQRGDFVVMDFAGARRRRAVPRRRGPRPDDRARLRPARARLRGAARGRGRRRGAARSRSRSRRTTARPSWPARRPSSRSPCARSRPSSCPSSTTSSPTEAGFDTLDELREDIRSRLAENESQRIEARVPRGGAGRRGRARRRSRCPDALIEARAREMWDSMLHSLSHQGIDRETYLRISGTLGGGDDRAGQAGRRAGAAARGRAGRGRRGRVARALRGGDARGGRRGGARARSVSPRSCWSACAPTAAWTASRTTCRSARRWTWWPSRPSRSRPAERRQIPDRPRDVHDPGRTTRGLDRAPTRC